MVLTSFRYIFIEWEDNFRQEYQQLSELRSFFQAPVMALTGTSTKKVKADITTHLHLSDEDTDMVCKLPDRPNIFI
jgi:superfamily II DNA helicase RecQ